MTAMQQTPSITIADIYKARETISTRLQVTPLSRSSYLSELTGREIFLKWDNRLRTGSFKERGVCNFLENLGAEQRQAGVMAASAGNHALALSFHAARVGVPCKIVMPRFAPFIKVESTRRYGAEIVLHGETFNEAYEEGLRIAAQEGRVFVPAFDHPWTIAGQGTIALEILEQLQEFDGIVVPTGGGGLLAGITVAMSALKAEAALIGVQSEWVTEQRATEPQPGRLKPATIADGIAVKRIGQLPLSLIDGVSFVHVSESAIARAIIHLLQGEKAVVEGAGAAGVAALLADSLPKELTRLVIVISGSNIDIGLLGRLIEWDMAEEQRLLQIKVSVPDRPGSLMRVADLVAEGGGNVIRVLHDRSFSLIPGNVDISFVLEVRDGQHQQMLLQKLIDAGLVVTRM